MFLNARYDKEKGYGLSTSNYVVIYLYVIYKYEMICCKILNKMYGVKFK